MENGQIERLIDLKLEALKENLQVQRDAQAKIEAERDKLLKENNDKTQSRINRYAIGVPIIASILSGSIAWVLGTHQAQLEKQAELDIIGQKIITEESFKKQLKDLDSEVKSRLDQQRRENKILIDETLTRINNLSNTMLDKLITAAEKSSGILAESEVIKQKTLQTKEVIDELERSEKNLTEKIQDNTATVKETSDKALAVIEALKGIENSNELMIQIAQDLDLELAARISVLETIVSGLDITYDTYELTLIDLTLTSPCDDGKGQIFHRFSVNGVLISEKNIDQRELLSVNDSYKINQSVSFKIPNNESSVPFTGYVRDYDGPRFGGLVGGYNYKTVSNINTNIKLKLFGKLQQIDLADYKQCTASLTYRLDKI